MMFGVFDLRNDLTLYFVVLTIFAGTVPVASISKVLRWPAGLEAILEDGAGHRRHPSGVTGRGLQGHRHRGVHHASRVCRDPVWSVMMVRPLTSRRTLSASASFILDHMPKAYAVAIWNDYHRLRPT